MAAIDDDQLHQWEAKSRAEEPAAGDAPPPQRQVGEFELLSELGRGGMGVVYRAWQPSLGRQVALKELRNPGDARAEARFAREIRALGRVEHPHLVKIFTSGSDGDRWYYAMELVEGAPLSAVCERLQTTAGGAAQVDLKTWQEAVNTVCTETRRAEKPLGAPPEGARPAPEPAAPVALAAGRNYVRHIADLMRQVAEALHALHEAGVVHRDVKPGNILVASDGSQATLMDLGLAQVADDVEGRLTRTRQFVGTLRYASPEQVLAVGRLDRRSDVYSLGATLWELLALRPLFGATDQTPTPDLMEKIQREEPGRLRKYHAGIPRDLEAIVQKCLEKDPGKRYATAAELARDLRRFLDGEPVRARPVGGWERGWKWVRRHPTKAAAIGLLAALVVALLAGGGFAAYFAVEANANYLDARQREKDAKDALSKLGEQERQVSEVNQRLEETLARSLMRPLGHKESEITDPELEALWELARTKDERVRLLFVEQALQGPMTTRQLRNRADLALHAALGLDPLRRQRVEEALLTRLRDAGSDLSIRTDCVRIGRALDDWSPGFASAVARQAVELTGTTTDQETSDSIAAALAALAPRLGPGEAADAARQIWEAMGKMTGAADLYGRAKALAVLAPRLSPGEATGLARKIVEAMRKATDRDALSDMVEALAPLVPRLEPGEAANDARKVVEEISKTTGRPSLGALAEALGALAPRLEPGEAADDARQVLEAMGKTENRNVLQVLAEALAALAPRLESAEAADDARKVVEAIGKTTDQEALYAWAGALAALAPRLESAEAADDARKVVEAMGKPIYGEQALSGLDEEAAALAALAPRLEPAQAAEEAQRVLEAMRNTTHPFAPYLMGSALPALVRRLGPGEAADEAQRVLEAMGKTAYPASRDALAEALAALAPRLDPGEAADDARRVLAAMGNTTDPEVLNCWAKALAALAPRMAPGEATDDARKTVGRTLEAMGKTTNSVATGALAEVLAALPPRLEPGDAADDARKALGPILQAMRDANSHKDMRGLAEAAVAALAPRLEPGEAADGARQVVDAMGKSFYPDILNALAEALRALAPRLDPGEAADDARRVLAAMGTTTDLDALNALAAALAALAPRLEPGEAADVARRVVEAMGKRTDPDGLYALAVAAAALIVRVEPENTSRRIRSIVWAVGDSAALPSLFTTLTPLAEASQSLPARFSDQQLVDLLKMPTCRQPARQVIVRQLGWQCGQHFDTMWDFVDWAQKNRPDLDLTSPPVRPAPVAP